MVWMLVALWAGMSGEETEEDLPLEVPAGFLVQECVSSRDIHDCWALTFDAQGQLLMSSPGKIRRAVLREGVATHVRDFAELPRSGAQGLWCGEQQVWYVGDGGLWRLWDRNADGVADGPPELLCALKTGGEHDAHAIRQGPDGWIYLILGNTSDVPWSGQLRPASPVSSPRAGMLVRLSLDRPHEGEVWGHGLRNAYDFAFTDTGEILVHDSDDEREITWPWYRPTRLFELSSGADAGWVSRGWKRPDTWWDMPTVVCSLGRGSPTGIEIYRHHLFPLEYRHSVWTLDWTYGRIWCVRLQRTGASWQGTPECFARNRPGHGFAPTDLEVGPDGALYVSVGGRGTRGAVYRIAPVKETESPTEAATACQRCLQAPQPLSSWSRAHWVPEARRLGRLSFVQAMLSSHYSCEERLRAVEILTECFGGLDEETLRLLLKRHQQPKETAEGSVPDEVCARAVWSYFRTEPQPSLEMLVLCLRDRSVLVQRAALETAWGSPCRGDWSSLVAPLAQMLRHEDRTVRWQAVRWVSQCPRQFLGALSAAATTQGEDAVLAYAAGWLHHPDQDPRRVQEAVFPLVRDVLGSRSAVHHRREALRLLMWCLGDTGPSDQLPTAFDGYTARLPFAGDESLLHEMQATLAEMYPTGDVLFDEDLSRVLAMLAPLHQKLLDKFLAEIDEDSPVTADLHRLLVMACLPVSRTAQQRQRLARAFVQLERKLQRQQLPREQAWNDRLKAVWERHCEHDPLLPLAVVREPEFGQPSHVLYMSQLAPEWLKLAGEGFLRQMEQQADYAYTPDVVYVLAALSDPRAEARLQSLWDKPELQDSVLMVWAEAPHASRRNAYVTGLSQPAREVWEACLAALEQLPPAPEPEENLALLRRLQRLEQESASSADRQRVMRQLARNMGIAPSQKPLDSFADWYALAERRWPEATHTAFHTSGPSDFWQRYQRAPWSEGDAARGATLFQRWKCQGCHAGAASLGPDLSGVTRRFSRHDLFLAIVDPHRDVPQRYQPVVLMTHQGKSYTGMIVYEATDGVLLRDASLRTVRVEATDIAERQRSVQSIMPSGLLDDATPQDLADLYAYLQTLGDANAPTTGMKSEPTRP
ncbi:MAG: heme-binding protein [Planctomycetaceae bacterium]|nr:MAG: heme-binding protein [Planctomycetaceae bacterium]